MGETAGETSERLDAAWSKAEIDRLPDSAFLFVEAGGEKDQDGRTTPRSLRHFPVKGPDGKLDLPHLRDAIGRIPQSGLAAAKKAELQAHAQKLLEDANGKSDAADRVQRYDLASGTLGGVRRTPQGGIIVEARPTRAGVFSYVQPDGSVRRELRHPDDVFEQDSLDSLEHAPVTIDHPEKVDPTNWRALAVGHVASKPARDGKFVSAELRIHDQDAIAQTDKKHLRELSCGYSCNLEQVSGEHDGEAYDARQKNIRYNHVAAGPEGWGRGGPEVRMRLDSGCAVSGADASFYVPAQKDSEITTMADENKKLDEAQAALSKAEKDAKDAKDALEKSRADAEKATTSAEKMAAQARLDAAEIAELKAKNTVLELQAKKHDGAKSAEESQAKLEARIEETISVRAKAAEVLGAEWKHDGKSIAEVKREVLDSLVPDFFETCEREDGMKREDVKGPALDAAYRAAVTHTHTSAARADRKNLSEVLTPHADAKKGMPGAEGDDEDCDKDDAVKKASAAMVAKKKDAWKTGRKFDRMRARDAQRSK